MTAPVPRPRWWDLAKVATVCWWRHRIRRVADGVYVTAACRSCTRVARWRRGRGDG